MVMRGLSWDSLKRNPSLIPLFVVVGAGLAAATFYPLRCAFKAPDVSWSSKNPEPWNEYENKQYKFYATPQAREASKQNSLPSY